MLKANAIKRKFYTSCGFLSLVTLHNACLKTSVNVPSVISRAPGVKVGRVVRKQIQIKAKESNTH